MLSSFQTLNSTSFIIWYLQLYCGFLLSGPYKAGEIDPPSSWTEGWNVYDTSHTVQGGNSTSRDGQDGEPPILTLLHSDYLFSLLSTQMRNGTPLQYFCLENPTDRSLEDYSPWGHKELDATEQEILDYWLKKYNLRSQCLVLVILPRLLALVMALVISLGIIAFKRTISILVHL